MRSQKKLTDQTYRTARTGALRPPAGDAGATHSESPVHGPTRGAAAGAWFAEAPATSTPGATLAAYREEFVFAAALLLVMGYAWSERLEGEITPKSGLGYMLGICGSLMMLSLLTYPLRKYWKPLQRLGSIRTWFRAHMALGVVGPALVVIHSNFNPGSQNATVALTLMLLVVASGIVGRYIYAHVYVDTTGERLDLRQLLQEAETLRAAFGANLESAPEIEKALTRFEADASAMRASHLGSFRATLFLPAMARKCHATVREEAEAFVSVRALRENWPSFVYEQRMAEVHRHFDAYFDTVQKAASLHFFARLFRFWHIFHLPLFLMLILAAVGHVVAVHLY